MLMLRVAFRNLLRQRRRTILTVGTMFGGFTLSAVSIGFSDGSYNRVIDMFTRNQLGHIQVHGEGYLDRPSLYKTVADYRTVGAQIERVPGVEFWAPRVKAAGLAAAGEKSAGARILGVEPARENRATRLDRKIVAGRSLADDPAGEAVLGAGLARTLHADLGAQVIIVSQAADGSIANDAYTLVGLAESGDQATDMTTIYLHLDDARTLFVLGERVHEIAVVVTDLDAVAATTAGIRAALDDDKLAVDPWQEFAQAFYHAMEVDRRGGWIGLGIIIAIVAVGVLNTVLMSVLERTREYGVLRAIGTSPGEVFRLVLLEVVMMALASIALGALAGWGVNYLLSIKGLYFGQSFTYGGIEFGRMYAEVNAQSFYIPALAVLLSAVAVSLFPATRAARIAPARAMRMH